MADDYAAKLANITSSDEQIEELKVRSEALYSKVKKQAAVLTKLRTAAAREVEKQMAARLIPLGMPNVRFRVEIGARKEPGVHGADTVNFLSLPIRTELCRVYLRWLRGGDSPRHAVRQSNDSRSCEIAHYCIR